MKLSKHTYNLLSGLIQYFYERAESEQDKAELLEAGRELVLIGYEKKLEVTHL